MSVLLPLCLLAALLDPGPALVVTRVTREGLPPYEDEARSYRLEGAGCRELRPGTLLRLTRPLERRALGELQVIEVQGAYALARLHKPGATYPLRGDVAIAPTPLATLPALPASRALEAAQPGAPVILAQQAPPEPAAPAKAVQSATAPAKAAMSAAAPARLPEPATGAARATAEVHREALFFRPGDAELTAGGLAKLKTWAAAWGQGGHWLLACPPWPGEAPALLSVRIANLRLALKALGVAELEVEPEPASPGRFPVIYVGMKSW